jgi:MerR family transcriptional regulator/heat shock protein HspR
MPTMDPQDTQHPLYAISVAGELTGVDPQMLRIYETRGLLTPVRTDGGTRRYSGRDIERIDRITRYLAAGLNLAGIAHVFALETETERLRDEVERLRGLDPQNP